MKKPLALALFIVLSLAHLAAALVEDERALLLTKPLLLSSLALWFWLETRGFKRRSARFLLAGLCFSWLGDVLLMGPALGRPSFFLFGLGAFLVAQLLFFQAFWHFEGSKKGSSIGWRGATVIVFFVAYLVELLRFLWPSLAGPMKAPVFLYGLAITSMGLSAFRLFGKMPARWATVVVVGALFFIASDSILAINKFAQPIPMASFWIMSTYLLAEASIAVGFWAALRSATPSAER